jgi:hypothetical protein
MESYTITFPFSGVNLYDDKNRLSPSLVCTRCLWTDIVVLENRVNPAEISPLQQAFGGGDSWDQVQSLYSPVENCNQ